MVEHREVSCKWCGRVFIVPRIRKNNAVKYCSPRCRRYAYLEKKAEASRRYNKKVDHTDDRRKLGNSNLKEHRNPDFDVEIKIIRKERRRLNI